MAQQPWTEVEIAQNNDFQSKLRSATPRVFITPILVALNVAVYLAMVATGVSFYDPPIDSLIKWGADFGPLVTHGQSWRLFTAMFLHIGIIHIAMNMYILWAIGKFTERLFGNFGFLVLYILSGFGGSLASVWWKPLTVSAGASGAIFGVYGALLGYLLIQRHSVPARSLSTLFSTAGTFIVYNLIYSYMSPNTDMAAHVGGFVSGFVLGCALALPLVEPGVKSRVGRGLVVLVLGAALVAAAEVRLPVIDDFEAEAKALGNFETATLAIYNDALKKVQAGQMTPAEFDDVIEKKIIPPWNARRESISHLRLAGAQLDFAQKVDRYMSLRSDAWKLIGEGVKNNKEDLVREGNDKQAEALALFKPPGK
ncbi:MAG TPA: rhomboid family intramembrane serine protease [Bryobacteraceae bacterium]